MPLVVESHGGWWKEARYVLARMARHLAAAQRADEDATRLQIA